MGNIIKYNYAMIIIPSGLEIFEVKILKIRKII